MKSFAIHTADGVQHIIIAYDKQEAIDKLLERGTYLLEEIMYVVEGSN